MKRLALTPAPAFFSKAMAIAQQNTGPIIGNVQEDADASLIGALLPASKSSIGISTVSHGNFAFQLLPNTKVPIFSSHVFQSQELEVGHSTQIDVVLAAMDAQLNKALVVGYKSVKKSNRIAKIKYSFQGGLKKIVD